MEAPLYPFSYLSPGIYYSSCWECWSHLEPLDLQGHLKRLDRSDFISTIPNVSTASESAQDN